MTAWNDLMTRISSHRAPRSADTDRKDDAHRCLQPALRDRPAWDALAEHHAEIGDRHLRELFAEDPGRGERLCAEAAGLYLDYSKNRITDETLGLLLQLAERVRGWNSAGT